MSIGCQRHCVGYLDKFFFCWSQKRRWKLPSSYFFWISLVWSLMIWLSPACNGLSTWTPFFSIDSLIFPSMYFTLFSDARILDFNRDTFSFLWGVFSNLSFAWLYVLVTLGGDWFSFFDCLWWIDLRVSLYATHSEHFAPRIKRWHLLDRTVSAYFWPLSSTAQFVSKYAVVSPDEEVKFPFLAFAMDQGVLGKPEAGQVEPIAEWGRQYWQQWAC